MFLAGIQSLISDFQTVRFSVQYCMCFWLAYNHSLVIFLQYSFWFNLYVFLAGIQRKLLQFPHTQYSTKASLQVFSHWFDLCPIVQNQTPRIFILPISIAWILHNKNWCVSEQCYFQVFCFFLFGYHRERRPTFPIACPGGISTEY